MVNIFMYSVSDHSEFNLIFFPWFLTYWKIRLFSWECFFISETMIWAEWDTLDNFCCLAYQIYIDFLKKHIYLFNFFECVEFERFDFNVYPPTFDRESIIDDNNKNICSQNFSTYSDMLVVDSNTCWLKSMMNWSINLSFSVSHTLNSEIIGPSF
jgi:hypothetical protein